MTLFGLTQNHLKVLKQKIQQVFGENTDLKVYIFGSRASGKNKQNSDIDLAFKSKSPDLNLKIQKLKNELEESSIPYKCDLVNWDEIIQDYLPSVKKYKKLFWSKDDVIINSPWRICPVGYHWVKEHLKEGNLDTTNPHCRRNPSRKDILKTDEIKKISEMNIFKKPTIKASTNDMGFKGLDRKYDDLINGWCAYWNYTLNPKEPLHPNHVKALIATESSFQDNHRRTPKRPAIGLMQIMPETIHLLSSRSKELKDHYIDLTEQDVLDPNVNICAGIRWLYRKYELSKKKNKSWLTVFENYKGISAQKGDKSDDIRNKILLYYNKLNHE
jgi:uncharacterized protein